ncbi:MAG TPA: bifunctional pyr operon transcriptional regulator/uracil phosphoribosyltransferase PyrR [Gammaproteobacteria bacterium]|nr:bifunctional pyr operon transcriptional regulator/uracil phosphoribosyltransferase PyrR [Gammaproteobacteria bacterium]
MQQLITQMAEELRHKFGSNVTIEDALMIGIHTGGVWVAERLHQALGIRQPLAQLDISFYRDDFSRIGMNPQVKPSQLPTSVDEAHIILVDDVLHTGRTIRAALNEIFDYGRPATVTLAVLGERSGRELPIQADVVGTHIQLGEHEHVKLTGPEPLRLEVVETP